MNTKIDFQHIEHENLGEVIYSKLSQALMQGELAPGLRLTIRELSTSLGTSITPVRDAILRLIQDHALIQKSPREVRVPVLTQKDYFEIRDIRVHLEGLAVRKATEMVTSAQIDTLWDLIRAHENAIKNEHWLEVLKWNQLFHASFSQLADMQIMTSILDKLWLRMGPLISGASRNGYHMNIDEHHSIIHAMEQRDPNKAEAALIRDITNASDQIISVLKDF